MAARKASPYNFAAYRDEPSTACDRRCRRCRNSISQPQRRSYCSDDCARNAQRDQIRAWKRNYRLQNGHWPHLTQDCWTLDRIREKNREYKRRSRARQRALRTARSSRERRAA